jgi:16S rRNA (cytidine1402-2'-O)-methyltransferase
MPGLLSVVATPIGNLEDITLRALRILREADLVAAEDTRRSSKLLTHHGIQTPTVSFHAHNVGVRLPQLLRRLEAGQHVALVTDAGTPGVSDPGVELVRACRAKQVPLQALPGPSASLAAAVLSGFAMIPLTILGFPPRRSVDRTSWFSQAALIPHTFTFFESPHRIASTAAECARYLVNRHICVARELTKIHEESPCFIAQDLISAAVLAKGEFTLVVGPLGRPEEQPAISDEQISARFKAAVARRPSASRREVLAEVGHELGLVRRLVYQALERTKG